MTGTDIAGKRASGRRRRLCLFLLVAVFAVTTIVQSTPSALAAEGDVSVRTGAELDAAIRNAVSGTVIRLDADVDAVASATYSVKGPFTIDGNGYQIDGKSVVKTALRFSSSDADVTIRNATFRNMKSSLSYGGGAIGVYRGKLTVENSAFIGNRHEGGSISTSTSNGGGAIVAHSSSSRLSVLNSTFYGNYSTAGGGAILSKGAATVNGVTVVGNVSAGGNGGGVCSSSSKVITLKNTIVTGNKNNSGAPSDIRYLLDGGHNLIGAAADFTAADTTTINLTPDAPGLEEGEPMDVGGQGGSPWVIPIIDETSPAVGGAGADAPEKDQPGKLRDGAPDIGAFEYVDEGPVKKPRANPRPGKFFDEPQVVLTTRTEGAEIYYTLDGTAPGPDNGLLYEGPVPITRSGDLKAVAVTEDHESGVFEGYYQLITHTPAISPAAGNYYEAREISLTADPGADIYYTTDGSEPDRGNGTLYADPFTLSANATVKAVAFLGERRSDILSADYTINLPQTVHVGTGTELDAILKTAGNTRLTVVILDNDIDAVTSATYTNNAMVAIDGNGHVIDGNGLAKTALRFKSSSADVTVRNATFKNMRSNLSYGGGALGVYQGKLTVEDSAFIGNRHEGSISTSTSNGGGAIVAHSSSSRLSVLNSTFYGNYSTAGGGAILSKGTATVNAVTVVGNVSAGGNGGGVCSSSSKVITLKNAIVAGNKNNSDAPCDTRYLVDGGHNLIGETDFTATAGTTVNVDPASLGIEPGEPQDAGGSGGSPFVIEITDPGSPAVGAAGADAPPKDQRGQLRDDAPDIGAFEYVDEGPVKKPRANPRPGKFFDEPQVTLTTRTGEADIYYTLDGTTPGRANGLLYTGPVPMTRSGELKAIAVTEDHESGVFEGRYQLITHTPNISPAAGQYYEAKEITLTADPDTAIYYTTDGSAPDRETGILYTGPFTLSAGATVKAIAYADDRVSDVRSASYAIRLPQTVHVETGAQLDAALKNAASDFLTIIVLDQDIDAVSSATYTQGARIAIDGGGYAIDGKGQSNTALRFRNENDDVTLRNVVMKNLKSSLSYGGGAIGVYRGDITIENSTFLGNEATGNSAGGGAVLAHSSSSYLKVVNSTFYGNESSGDDGEGGAIQAKGCGDIIHCTIVGNSATNKGGGIRNESTSSTGQTWIYNTIIVGNSGSNGPDVYRATDMGGNIFGATYGVLEQKPALTLADYSVGPDKVLTEPPAPGNVKLADGAPQPNGGMTPTIALLDDSPAIDFAQPQIGPGVPSKDQRGYLRGPSPDAGSFEYEGLPDQTLRNNLTERIDEANQVYASKVLLFLTSVRQAFSDALNAAETLLATGPFASGEDLLAAADRLSALFAVIDGESEDDLRITEAMLDQADAALTTQNGRNPADYTAASFTRMAGAAQELSAAVAASDDCSLAQGTALLNAFAEAQNALVSIKALRDSLALAAEMLASDQYTSDSLARLRSAVVSCQGFVSKADATRQEIDDACKALTTSISQLVEKQDGGDTPDPDDSGNPDDQTDPDDANNPDDKKDPDGENKPDGEKGPNNPIVPDKPVNPDKKGDGADKGEANTDKGGSQSLSSAVIAKIPDYSWTGKQIRPAVTVRLGGKQLKRDLDYQIRWGDNRNIGKATVRITAKPGGAFTGTKTAVFHIVPSKPKALKLKPGKAGSHTLSVSFLALNKAQNVKVYKVACRQAGAKNWKIRTVIAKRDDRSTLAKTVTVQLRNLKAKKTWEVRVYGVQGPYKGIPSAVKRATVK